ncbi:pentatricopeptide repeat-containing protein At2g19280 isoform X2 [Jatropha curcas]|uniref:pentatricopeptide repeat-containing protein At2g19280 isoform X2 n=1 Tax=Jatropha curcas TaxID=180498 RepID=UPI0009D7963E|nr:pentatricopeptide repeat-containing protein At2g19280 isoform X2 [Jatropha curcas]
MRGSISIRNVALKLMHARKGNTRFFSSFTLSPCEEEDGVSPSAGFSLLPKPNSNILDHHNSEVNDCWNLGSTTESSNGLNQFSVLSVLNDMFEESFKAAFALYFFRLSDSCSGFECTVRSACRLIFILVSGNMNYRAVDLIQFFARNKGGEVSEEEFCDLLFTLLYESSFDTKALQTVYSMLVGCYVSEKKVNLALQLINKMKLLYIFPSMGVCNSLLQALLGLQQLDLAWDFLEEMKSQGMVLNASIFSLFISRYCAEDALCKMTCLKEATSLLFKMFHWGISVDSVLVSSVIDGYCKMGKLEEAVYLLKYFKFRPNIFVYNSFLSKLCTDGNMIQASKIFLEMFELGLHPDCFSYTTIIGGYCKVKDINKAFQYLGKMLKCGIKPSVTTITLLIDACCTSGDIEMAEYLFQRMILEDLVPDIVTYNCLIDGCGKKGYLQKAFEVLDIMRSAGICPNAVSYNALVHGLITRGFVNEAKDILEELIRRDFSPDVVTFTNVIDGYSKKGDFEEAFFVWLYMSEHQVKPDVVTCSALLNGYCRARRIDEANALFHKMLDIGLKPDLILYNTLIRGFCVVGNMDAACNLVSTMINDGIFPNNITHWALVLGFEKKWAKNPELSAAFKMQQILLRHGICVDVNEYLAMVHQPTS